jgi:hypothetical protein
MLQELKIYQLTSVKRVFAKHLGELHKITLDKLHLLLKTCFLRVPTRAANLEIIVVQARNIDIRELRNFTSRTADTTADVENAHARLKLH